MVFLSDLKVGDKSKIFDFITSGEGSDAQESQECVVAMMRIGIVPGAEIKIVSIAFGGDPIAFDSRGTRFAVGKKEARLIRLVEVET